MSENFVELAKEFFELVDLEIVADFFGNEEEVIFIKDEDYEYVKELVRKIKKETVRL